MVKIMALHLRQTKPVLDNADNLLLSDTVLTGASPLNKHALPQILNNLLLLLRQGCGKLDLDANNEVTSLLRLLKFRHA